jgi:phage gpG-like protein
LIEWDTGGAISRLTEMAAGLNAGNLARQAGLGLVRGTQESAPVLTGTLRRSIRINSISGGGGRGEAVYGPHVIYAGIQDQGGVITIKHKKVLANVETGQFFGTSVEIPAQHYMERGADTGTEYAYQRVSAAVSRAMDG